MKQELESECAMLTTVCKLLQQVRCTCIAHAGCTTSCMQHETHTPLLLCVAAVCCCCPWLTCVPQEVRASMSRDNGQWEEVVVALRTKTTRENADFLASGLVKKLFQVTVAQFMPKLCPCQQHMARVWLRF
jgi:hypothetical protein